MKFSYTIGHVINRGVTTETELDDVRRIRLINISFLIGLVLIPLILLYNSIIGKPNETYPILFCSVIVILGFALNKQVSNQVALILLLLGGIICSYWVTAISETQTAAPYFDLLFGVSAIFLFKKKSLKVLIGITAFLSFVLLNAYQQQYKLFSIQEYIPISIMLITTFVSLYRINTEFERNELTIKQQATDLLNLQKEKHKVDLDFKQKDIDTIVANNRMQLHIRENILDRLGKIKEDKGSLKEIQSIKNELMIQIETQRKLNFSEQNIEEINAQYFERLLLKHPKLSKKERELCSYIRLNLSTKQIATLTNSSLNTIYVTKNRLKVKLNLETNAQVDTYLLNF